MHEKPIKKAVSVTLTLDVYDRLKGYADEDSRTLSGEIRQILKGYLEYLDRGGVSWCSNYRNRGVEQYTCLPLGESYFARPTWLPPCGGAGSPQG